MRAQLPVGLNKGHKVKKFVAEKKKSGPNRGKKMQFVREVIREVVGLAPYERYAIELLRLSRDKRALKFLKKRLGTHRRGKNKRQEMQVYIQASRKAQIKK